MARPKAYTPEKLKSAIEDYLSCIEEGKMPTKAGLFKHLGISRQTWHNYHEEKTFIDTIKDAEFTIEDAWNQKLVGSGATGPIFYLKNAFKEHYRDSHDITSDGKSLSITFDNALKPPQ